jgi:hypothetical protein
MTACAVKYPGHVIYIYLKMGVVNHRKKDNWSNGFVKTTTGNTRYARTKYNI